MPILQHSFEQNFKIWQSGGAFWHNLHAIPNARRHTTPADLGHLLLRRQPLLRAVPDLFRVLHGAVLVRTEVTCQHGYVKNYF